MKPLFTKHFSAVTVTLVILALIGAATTTIYRKSLPHPRTFGEINLNFNRQTDNLAVPYIAEAPDGHWVSPWINACEEASITMVEKYYAGEQTVGTAEAKQFMQMLFDVQDKAYGSNINADAARMHDIINQHTSFTATIKDNPTVEDIKEQIRNDHPVISLHYGFALHNKDINFLATGSSYHVIVIKGYDDERQEFIVHDDGDQKMGADHRYSYDTIMNSIHDYVFGIEKANGTPRVLFTEKKAAQ